MVKLDPSDRLTAAEIALKDVHAAMSSANWKAFIHHTGAVMGLLRQAIYAAEQKQKENA